MATGLRVGGPANRGLLTAAVLSCVLLCGALANAQSAPFFHGKAIRIIAGFTSGGLYDQYARILARHMFHWTFGV